MDGDEPPVDDGGKEHVAITIETPKGRTNLKGEKVVSNDEDGEPYVEDEKEDKDGATRRTLASTK